MNLSVHRPMPFHSQYSRATAANMAKKNDGKETSISFQDILQEKMKVSRDRQTSGASKTIATTVQTRLQPSR